MKSVLWRVAKRLSYMEDARCLKFNKSGRKWKKFSYKAPDICPILNKLIIS